MKKNTAPFVCGLIGAIFGLIGGILWSACASVATNVEQAVTGGASSAVYLACFIIFGIGGSVITLVGAIMAFGWKKSGFPLLLVGTLFQLATIIAACVAVHGFSFVLNICTIVALILLVVATILAIVKKNPNNQQTTTTDAE